MIKNTLLFCSILLLASCGTQVHQIGQLNMMSQRNVDPKLGYTLLANYSGGSKKELKNSTATSLQSAVDQTVKKIPGGEFLMNVKVYQIDKKYFAAEGDVWGVNSNLAHRGYKVGDKIMWKTTFGVIKQGTIKSLKDDKSCIIEDTNGNLSDKKYDEIFKGE